MKNLKISFDQEFRIILILIIFFIYGFLLHHWEFTRKYVLFLTDLFLLFSNSLVFYYLYTKEGKQKKLIIWGLSAFVFTFLVEYAGVTTSLIFGSYRYGETMFLQIGNVPVVIAFNWIMLVLAVTSISRKIVKHSLIVPLLSAILILVFDIILEPVAIRLDYWQWENNLIPVRNYIAWFILGLLLSASLEFFRIKADSKLLRAFFFIQLLYFILFNVVSGTDFL